VRARVVTAILSALVPVLALATPAHAAPGVNIYRVYYDSPGSDTGSNTSLNAEYVTLKNYGTTTKTLTGWTIRDAANHVYTFGSSTLAGGATVTVHTGSGTNTSSHRYWSSGAYIWNNTGDTAYLRRADGTTADECSFGSTADDKLC